MADKDKKTATLRDPDTGKFLGKYDSEEDAVKGWTELEKKFGAQGGELGDLKKEIAKQQELLKQYKEWADKASPIIDWYGKYQQPITQWWNQYNTQGNGGQPAQPANPYMQASALNQAAGMVNQMAGAELLTPQEKMALINQTAQHLIQQTIAPWSQQFAKNVETWGTQQVTNMRKELEDRYRAQSDVLWRTLERIIPPDKLKEVQDWHNESLKYADPKNIDPMKLSSDSLSFRSRIAQLEQELKDAREQTKKYEQQSLGNLGEAGGAGLFRKPTDIKEAPKSREERMKNVVQQTKEAVGVEGFREAFPTV